MKTLLNRFATWLWDKTTATEHTIDDLSCALTQADYWQQKYASEKQFSARLAAHVEELTTRRRSQWSTRHKNTTPKDTAQPKATKPAKAEGAPKERRSRRSGPIKD